MNQEEWNQFKKDFTEVKGWVRTLKETLNDGHAFIKLQADVAWIKWLVRGLVLAVLIYTIKFWWL